MSILFEPLEIRGVRLENRIVIPPMASMTCTKTGLPTADTLETYMPLAGCGAGLAMIEHHAVIPEGRTRLRQLLMDRDEILPYQKDLASLFSGRNMPALIQLNHAGSFIVDEDLLENGWIPKGPSPIRHPRSNLFIMPTGLSTDEISAIPKMFADAANRAVRAGYPGVEIHAAHGYLLNQFLSPWFNRRADRYGGGIENRTRIVLDILASVRSATGRDCPVLVKMNSEDFLEGGLTREDSLQAALMIASAGADAIELSGGTLLSGKLSPSRSKIDSVEQEAYFRDAARAFKAKLNIPLALVGGIRSFEVAEGLVKEGIADFISMSRPFIREPGLVNRWKSGDRRKATCLSDNRCFMPPMRGTGFYCVVDREGKEGS